MDSIDVIDPSEAQLSPVLADLLQVITGFKKMGIDPEKWSGQSNKVNLTYFFGEWVNRVFEWDPNEPTEILTQYCVGTIVKWDRAGQVDVLREKLYGDKTLQPKQFNEFSFVTKVRFGDTPNEIAVNELAKRLNMTTLDFTGKTSYKVELGEVDFSEPVDHPYIPPPFKVVNRIRNVTIVISSPRPPQEFTYREPGENEICYGWTKCP